MGQWCLGHEGGAADPFEMKWGQWTHRHEPPLVACLGQRRTPVLGQGGGGRRQLPGRRAPEHRGGARG
jgi:hypothetical protein